MTVVRVNPASVRQYGNAAETTFGEIRTELVNLVNAATQVRYFGPNAVSFKTHSGQLAADFANKLNKDIAQISHAVRASTSAIAGSLGGEPIVIDVNVSPITPPGVESVDYVDVDTSALESLTGTVNGHFGRITGLFDQHLQKLLATDWEGNAKVQASTAVQGFTSQAKTTAEQAQASLNKYINGQLQAVTAADK
jgi:hypothetical protein